MGIWAEKTLYPQRNSLGVSGFKEKYISGGQNGGAMVHIAGVAGATLIGDARVDPTGVFRGNITGYQLAQAQFDQDTRQLSESQALWDSGVRFTTYDNQANYPVDRLIQERHAERWGTGAGSIVGAILTKAHEKEISIDDARTQIFNLLCDR
jgi:hypothetical protein